jgi:hypothetical protein
VGPTPALAAPIAWPTAPLTGDDVEGVLLHVRERVRGDTQEQKGEHARALGLVEGVAGCRDGGGRGRALRCGQARGVARRRDGDLDGC